MQLKIIFQGLFCVFCAHVSAQTDLIPFRKGNLWGFSKPNKTIVISCQYDEVHFFENHKALIRKGLLYGLIDETGREVYPCKSYIPIVSHCGRARIAKTQKTLSGNNRLGIPFQTITDYGFINEKGVEIIPCIYKLADDFHENYAFVSKEGDFKIYQPRDFGFEVPRVYYAGKGGFIDKNGKPIGDFNLSAGLLMPVFQNGLAIVQKGNLFGIINTQNKVIAPFIYYQLAFSDGGFMTNIADKYGWLDVHGREILPPIYEAVVRSFPHLTVKQHNKLGLFDSTGHQLLPFNYEQRFDFQEVTKDIFADSAYLGRYIFLLSDQKQDSIPWMDIKAVLNLSVEGAKMPPLEESIQPIPFQIDAISTPVVPQNLFETIENQKVVNYYIHTCGEDITQAFMLLNYNPSISAQQLEAWAKTLFQKPMGCDEEMFNVLFAQKVVTISTAAE